MIMMINDMSEQVREKSSPSLNLFQTRRDEENRKVVLISGAQL